MTFKVIRGQGQGQEMTAVPSRDYFYFQTHDNRNVTDEIVSLVVDVTQERYCTQRRFLQYEV